MRQHRNESSIYQLIDRKFFEELVDKHGMDKGIRSFTTWEFTCGLITSMILKLNSYREIEEALDVPRSTFGDAMNNRFSGFFQDLCDHILLKIRGRTQDRKTRRAIRQILAIDSTEIQVHGSIFSLPGWQKKQSDGHQASCKLHLIYNVDNEWIDDFKVTGARKHDSPVSLQLRLLPNKLYVFDKAYNDIDFWLKIMSAKSDFVTRLKDCKKLKELQTKVLKEKGDQDGVLFDGFYVPSQMQMHLHSEILEITQLRHIIYRAPDTKKVFHFITSDLKLSAKTIAGVYKRRWGVELLFKWLKGHLDLRYLPVKGANAAKIQLAVAVLVQLLLQLKKIKTEFNGTLWELLRKIRTSQFKQILSGGPDPGGCRWSNATVKSTDGVCL
jgi:putative transposase